MICDAVEAASRTLIEPTPAKIRAMIQTIVDDCLRDGQFDECDLTMRDLAVIVDTLEQTGLDDVPPPHRLSRLRVQSRAAAPQDRGDSGGVRAGPLDGPPRRVIRAMEIDVASSVSGSPPPRRVRALVTRIARAIRARSRVQGPRSRGEVSVLFCGDRKMRGAQPPLSEEDRPTDVLAFPAGGRMVSWATS